MQNEIINLPACWSVTNIFMDTGNGYFKNIIVSTAIITRFES